MIDLENVFRINLDLSRGQEKPILSTSQIGNYLPATEVLEEKHWLL